MAGYRATPMQFQFLAVSGRAAGDASIRDQPPVKSCASPGSPRNETQSFPPLFSSIGHSVSLSPSLSIYLSIYLVLTRSLLYRVPRSPASLGLDIGPRLAFCLIPSRIWLLSTGPRIPRHPCFPLNIHSPFRRSDRVNASNAWHPRIPSFAS